MASVTLSQSPAAPPAASAGPVWYRERHSYLLAGVVASQLILAVVLVKVISHFAWSEGVTAAVLGCFLGQTFLLGLWAALGGLPTIPRWLLIGSVYFLGVFAVVFGNNLPDDWDNLRRLGYPEVRDAWQATWRDGWETLLTGGVLFTGFGALLLPLRRLMGWRVDFDPRYYASVQGRRGQVAMLEFAAFICAVALPLTLIRLMIPPGEGLDLEAMIILPIVLVAISAIAAPAALAALSPRRTALWLLASAGWVVAVAWLQSLASVAMPELAMFGGSPWFFGLNPSLVALYGGMTFAVACTLLSLRLAGLRLLNVHAPPT